MKISLWDYWCLWTLLDWFAWCHTLTSWYNKYSPLTRPCILLSCPKKNKRKIFFFCSTNKRKIRYEIFRKDVRLSCSCPLNDSLVFWRFILSKMLIYIFLIIHFELTEDVKLLKISEYPDLRGKIIPTSWITTILHCLLWSFHFDNFFLTRSKNRTLFVLNNAIKQLRSNYLTRVPIVFLVPLTISIGKTKVNPLLGSTLDHQK